LNYRAIRRPIVETTSNYKDLIAQRDSKEKYKTSSYPASSPKVGVETGQKTAGASLKSKYKNSSRDITIIRGQKTFARFTSGTISSRLFPYTTTKRSPRRRPNRDAAEDMRTRTSLHKHKNEKTHVINVSDVTDGSYF